MSPEFTLFGSSLCAESFDMLHIVFIFVFFFFFGRLYTKSQLSVIERINRLWVTLKEIE